MRFLKNIYSKFITSLKRKPYPIFKIKCGIKICFTNYIVQCASEPISRQSLNYYLLYLLFTNLEEPVVTSRLCPIYNILHICYDITDYIQEEEEKSSINVGCVLPLLTKCNLQFLQLICFEKMFNLTTFLQIVPLQINEKQT